MGKSFKEYSFFKKVVSIFGISVGVIVVMFILTFGLFAVTEHVSPSGEMAAQDLEHLGSSSDSYVSENSSYISKSSDVSDNYADSDTTRFAKDYSISIDTRDVMGTVDNVVSLSNKYDAIYEGSSAGDNGYGYAAFKVPNGKVDAFVKSIRDTYNVVSYTRDVDNMDQAETDRLDQIKTLQEQLELCEKDLEEAREAGEDTQFLLEDIHYYKTEIQRLEDSKEDIDNEVLYSDVYISVENSSYTGVRTFEGVWSAIKYDAHLFVLGIVHGIYFLLYLFIMIMLGKWCWFKVRAFKGEAKRMLGKPEESENVEPSNAVSGAESEALHEKLDEVK